MGLTPYVIMVSTMSLAILSPGPAIIAAIQTAFSRGREQALRYGIGLAFGASLWALFSLFGLAVLFALYPPLYLALRLLGGAYLIWMAWGLWRASTQDLPDAAERGIGRNFWGGVVLNLSNPKPALFYTALILSVFPGTLTPGHQAGIYITALATELFWYITIVMVMSLPLMRGRYFAAKFWIDRMASLALFALGLILIINH